LNLPEEHAQLFIKNGFDSIENLLLVDDSDLNSWGKTIPIGHSKKIKLELTKLKEEKKGVGNLHSPTTTTVPTIPVKVVPNKGDVVKQSREERRRDPPTARLQPGKRFLQLVPDAPLDQQSVIDCLIEWAQAKKLDTFIIDDTIAKIEDLCNEGHERETAFSLSLCWLYTTDSWVYKQINALLRNDSPSMKVLAPFMNSLMNVYDCLKKFENFFFEGVVYRRTKLSGKDLDFYKPNGQFVWSAFTSTTSAFDPSDQFGDILFVITIPPKYKKYALDIQSVSEYSTEQEILLLPNIGYTIKSIENGPVESFPNSRVVIHLVVSYVCVT